MSNIERPSKREQVQGAKLLELVSRSLAAERNLQDISKIAALQRIKISRIGTAMREQNEKIIEMRKNIRREGHKLRHMEDVQSQEIEDAKTYEHSRELGTKTVLKMVRSLLRRRGLPLDLKNSLESQMASMEEEPIPTIDSVHTIATVLWHVKEQLEARMALPEAIHIPKPRTKEKPSRQSGKVLKRHEKKKQPVSVHNRIMLRNDLQKVLDIEERSFEHPWSEEDFLNMLRRSGCDGYVAEHNESIVGYWIYQKKRGKLLLVNFVVHPKLRRRSIGTQMMYKLFSRLRRGGRRRIQFAIGETNVAGQQFLQAQEFVGVRVLKNYFEDKGQDAYLMEYVHSDEKGERLLPVNRIKEFLGHKRRKASQPPRHSPRDERDDDDEQKEPIPV